MADQGARLTPLGKIISIVLILGLIGAGIYLVMQRGIGGRPGGGMFSTEAPDTVEAISSRH